ncbi:MAG: hypothetical protein GY866_37810 [Proteobacteria bacterium]|nr:hypothetical protein [Pseudomonadota bacterium]
MEEIWEERGHQEENQNEAQNPPFSGLSLKNIEEYLQNVEAEKKYLRISAGTAPN